MILAIILSLLITTVIFVFFWKTQLHTTLIFKYILFLILSGLFWIELVAGLQGKGLWAWAAALFYLWLTYIQMKQIYEHE